MTATVLDEVWCDRCDKPAVTNDPQPLCQRHDLDRQALAARLAQLHGYGQKENAR